MVIESLHKVFSKVPLFAFATLLYSLDANKLNTGKIYNQNPKTVRFSFKKICFLWFLVHYYF